MRAITKTSLLLALVTVPVPGQSHGDLGRIYKPVNADFQAAYNADTANQRRESSRDYLDWVHKFYNGSWLSKGWLDREQEVIDKMPPNQRAVTMHNLNIDGFLIAAEWSKDNGVRRIDTSNMSTWGGWLADAMNRDNGSGDRINAAIHNVAMAINRALRTGPAIPVPRSM